MPGRSYSQVEDHNQGGQPMTDMLGQDTRAEARHRCSDELNISHTKYLYGLEVDRP